MISSKVNVEELNKKGFDCLVGHLGIEIVEVGPDFIIGKMPVDERTKQPYGILHGGASVVLAESLGSYGSSFIVDMEKEYPVGLEINANHVRSVSEGYVTGKATLVHCGRKTHIWDIRITDQKDKLVCISRLTVAVVQREKR